MHSFTQWGGTLTVMNSSAKNGGVVDFDDWWFQGFTRRVENGFSALTSLVVCRSCMYFRKFPEVLPAFSFF